MKVKHTIQLFSHFYRHGCEICEEKVRDSHDDLSKAINHYVQAHGYELLHVGANTSEGNDGTWHGTTAILGSEVIPDPKPIDNSLDEYI